MKLAALWCMFDMILSHSVNWLAFVMDTFFELGTEVLNNMQLSLGFKGLKR
jgi:hypothetical protein